MAVLGRSRSGAPPDQMLDPPLQLVVNKSYKLQIFDVPLPPSPQEARLQGDTKKLKVGFRVRVTLGYVSRPPPRKSKVGRRVGATLGDVPSGKFKVANWVIYLLHKLPAVKA